MTEIAHLTFVELPRDVNHIYATTRVLIAPHAFGGGNPYTVSNIEVYLRLFVIDSFLSSSSCIYRLMNWCRMPFQQLFQFYSKKFRV